MYSATGTKKGTATLPKTLFEAPINEGLMHQFVVLQQSNLRTAIAHTKGRGEIQGSTRKLFRQKGTGRARRGQVRSPLLRGGNKAFGPLKNANYKKDMPKAMRRAALLSCLSYQAKNNVMFGLEDYPDEIKTKNMQQLLTKLPVDIGRNILFVLPEKHEGITFSLRNIPSAHTVLASYLNPVDVLGARHIVFVGDALKKAEEVFGKKEAKTKEAKESKEAKEAKDSLASSKKASSASSKKKSSTSKK